METGLHTTGGSLVKAQNLLLIKTDAFFFFFAGEERRGRLIGTDNRLLELSVMCEKLHSFSRKRPLRERLRRIRRHYAARERPQEAGIKTITGKFCRVI